MSYSYVETVSPVGPLSGPKLGPVGLATFIFTVFGATLAIVGAAVWWFPEVIEEQLPVSVLLDGYAAPEEVAASVEAFKVGQGEVIEPYLIVKNNSDQTLTSVYMRINRNFLFHMADPLPAGGVHKFYLSRFIEPDGSRFWPHRYPVERVEVRGRLPSLKQAIMVRRWDDLVGTPGDAANAAASVAESEH